MYRINYLDMALLDLEEILEFYALILNNLEYGLKITKKIKTKIKSLKNSPERCESFDFVSKNPIYPSPIIYTYRKLVVGDYIVLYIVDHTLKKIEIVRVFDGRSDYQKNL